MYRSKDGKITVEVVTKMDNLGALPAAAFSLVNIPVLPMESKTLFERLYNTPSKNHIVLAFARHSRATKLESLGNLGSIPFKFLDQIHIWYEKPSSSSNIGLLPVAEDAYIFYKDDAPKVKNTNWYSVDHPNASNMWGVTPYSGEGRAHTHYRYFSWEVALLLWTMANPIETRKLIYGLEDDHYHVLKFCREYDFSAHILTKASEEAQKIIARADLT